MGEDERTQGLQFGSPASSSVAPLAEVGSQISQGEDVWIVDCTALKGSVSGMRDLRFVSTLAAVSRSPTRAQHRRSGQPSDRGRIASVKFQRLYIRVIGAQHRVAGCP